MPTIVTCPQGHFWEGDAAHPMCPICGSAPEADDETALGRVDDIPPPPRDTGVRKNLFGTSAAWPEIPGFEIVAELGRGGMGLVYKARQDSLGRAVALKIIASELQGATEVLARFRIEAESIAQLQHPNIVNVHDIVPFKNSACLIMELVEGGALDRQLAGKPITPHSAARLVLTLARAMHAVHAKGIIHRDLKPANILLTADGTPKITDFGLAKRLDQAGSTTRSGFVMGTPHYMAPEQAEGLPEKIGPATDVYALGAILYETLTGQPPFRGTSTTNILKQVLFDPASPPSHADANIPPALDAICLKCLQKEPAQRYASAAAFADDLARFIADTEQTTDVARKAEPARRPRRIWATGLAIVLIAVTMLAFDPDIRRWLFDLVGGNTETDVPAPIQLHWTLLASPATEKDEAFDRLAFPSEKVGYLASRRALYKTVDGGDTWRALNLPRPGRAHLLQFADEQTGWLATDKLWHTTDGGATWRDILPDAKMRAVTAAIFHADGWALVGGVRDTGTLALFHRSDAKANWTALALTGDLKEHETWSLAALAFNQSTGLAVLYDHDAPAGVVLRKSAHEPNWRRVLRTGEILDRVHLGAKGEAWVTGFGGGLYHSKDAGTTFEAMPHPDPDKFAPRCVAFEPSGRLGLAPLWKGKVLARIDAEPWMIHETPLGLALSGAVVVHLGCAYVLGADGRVARFLQDNAKK